MKVYEVQHTFQALFQPLNHCLSSSPNAGHNIEVKQKEKENSHPPFVREQYN